MKIFSFLAPVHNVIFVVVVYLIPASLECALASVTAPWQECVLLLCYGTCCCERFGISLSNTHFWRNIQICR